MEDQLEEMRTKLNKDQKNKDLLKVHNCEFKINIGTGKGNSTETRKHGHSSKRHYGETE